MNAFFINPSFRFVLYVIDKIDIEINTVHITIHHKMIE